MLGHQNFKLLSVASTTVFDWSESPLSLTSLSFPVVRILLGEVASVRPRRVNIDNTSLLVRGGAASTFEDVRAASIAKFNAATNRIRLANIQKEESRIKIFVFLSSFFAFLASLASDSSKLTKKV